MTNEVKLSQEQMLLAEAIMKVASLERLLIKKGIFTPEELFAEAKSVSDEVVAFAAKQVAEQKSKADTNGKPTN